VEGSKFEEPGKTPHVALKGAAYYKIERMANKT
jgi:hypothetical protein